MRRRRISTVVAEKTRTAVTAAEVDFSAPISFSPATPGEASLCKRVTLPGGATRIAQMPRVEPILREFEKRKQDESWDSAKDRIVLTREFLDELFLQRLVNMKTHPKLGDLPIVKMFETGYKRTGDIQPARISAEAKANNISQLYARRLYLPRLAAKQPSRGSRLPNKRRAEPELITEGDARQR